MRSRLALLLAIAALHTAIRIEILNTLAGRTLPLTPLENGFVPKWRAFMWETPERWRKMFGPKDATGQPLDRPLTAEETQVMNESVARVVSRNELRGVIEDWGLAQ